MNGGIRRRVRSERSRRCTARATPGRGAGERGRAPGEDIDEAVAMFAGRWDASQSAVTVGAGSATVFERAVRGAEARSLASARRSKGFEGSAEVVAEPAEGAAEPAEAVAEAAKGAGEAWACFAASADCSPARPKVSTGPSKGSSGSAKVRGGSAGSFWRSEEAVTAPAKDSRAARAGFEGSAKGSERSEGTFAAPSNVGAEANEPFDEAEAWP